MEWWYVDGAYCCLGGVGSLGDLGPVGGLRVSFGSKNKPIVRGVSMYVRDLLG